MTIRIKPLVFKQVREGKFIAKTLNGYVEYFINQTIDGQAWTVICRLMTTENRHSTFEQAEEYANKIHSGIILNELQLFTEN